MKNKQISTSQFTMNLFLFLCVINFIAVFLGDTLARQAGSLVIAIGCACYVWVYRETIKALKADEPLPPYTYNLTAMILVVGGFMIRFV